jgi:hypothetical protein
MRDVIRKERPKRIPLGDRNKLTVSGITDKDEYMYRWVNDVEDRIMSCFNAGYDFVDKNGKTVGDATVESARGTSSVMSKGVGQGITAFLMKVPKEIWLEDRKRRVDEPTDQLEAGMKQQSEDKSKGFYGKVDVGSK